MGLGSAHVEVKFLQFELSARRYRGRGWKQGQGVGTATGTGAGAQYPAMSRASSVSLCLRSLMFLLRLIAHLQPAQNGPSVRPSCRASD